MRRLRIPEEFHVSKEDLVKALTPPEQPPEPSYPEFDEAKLQRLQARAEDLASQCNTLSDRFNRARTTLRDLEAQLANIQQNQQFHETALHDIKAERDIKRLENDISRVRRDMEDMDAQREKLSRRHENVRGLVASMEEYARSELGWKPAGEPPGLVF